MGEPHVKLLSANLVRLAVLHYTKYKAQYPDFLTFAVTHSAMPALNYDGTFIHGSIVNQDVGGPFYLDIPDADPLRNPAP